MMWTIRRASEETGMSYYFIRQLCIEGKIKFVRSGVKYYINSESLKAYCEGGESL